jgi:hypothetical protein
VFEKTLQTKLKNIFQVDNVRFSVTSKDTNEQGVLFIDVAESTTRFTPKKAHAKVIGSIYMYSPNDKMKFGFFEMALRAASPEDKKGLFFTAFDQSREYQGDLVERRTNFVYLHSQDYDKDGGGLMTRAMFGATDQEIQDAYEEDVEELDPDEEEDDTPTDDEGA